jgi:hypothetical protein
VTKGGGRENFAWGKEQKQEFDDLKHHLCSTLVLSLPDLQQLFNIETDASDYCWVCLIFFACVCVGASSLITMSNDPSRSVLCVMWIGCFPRGVPRGGRYAPPSSYTENLGQRPKIFFWVVFSIFKGFCYF